jgi:hypothetical protein
MGRDVRRNLSPRLWVSEPFPGSTQAGTQFAISSFAGQPDTGTAVRWQSIFGTAPTAVSIVLKLNPTSPGAKEIGGNKF